MDEPRTTETILAKLEANVIENAILPPTTWLDAGLALTALIGDEHHKYAKLFQLVSQMKLGLIKAGATAIAAKVEVEASDEYYQLSIQKARIEQIEEMVRLAKVRARLADSELHQ